MIPKYEVLDSPDQEDGGTARVMICEGPFEAFVYRYGAIKFLEEDDDPATLQFDYDLESAPEDYISVDEEKEKVDFETLVGDILVDIITKAIDKQDGFDLDNPGGTDE
jgi:hypothetical protein